MYQIRFWKPALLASVLACSVAFAGPAPHNDFEIGQDGASSPKLMIEGDFANVIELFPGDGAFDDYFVADEPGWEAIELPEPPELFPLLSGHRAALQNVSLPNGFNMYNSSLGPTPLMPNANDLYEFAQDPPGSGSFHEDLIFGADNALWSPGQTFTADYRLVDVAGLHSPSDPFTLTFRIVPEPTTLGLLALGGLLANRRRR